MTESSQDLAPTKKLAVKVIYAALNILKNNDGELPGREVISEIGKTVDLNDWEKERYPKTGYIRWQSVLHFYTIHFVKAGYLVKKKSVWYLTQEGEKALYLGPIGLLNSAAAAYKKWKESVKKEIILTDSEVIDDVAHGSTVDLDEIERIALDSLTSHINNMNPYEFQDLAASLLRAMGYYTPFVAPRGKDGGVDIIAYRDPFGTESPRIKVQVKHRESPANVQEVRQLMGLLLKDGDVGIFISSGGFTSDAKVTARDSHVHLELIDLSRFLSLWEEFYKVMPDEDKSRLLLLSINFLAPIS